VLLLKLTLVCFHILKQISTCDKRSILQFGYCAKQNVFPQANCALQTNDTVSTNRQRTHNVTTWRFRVSTVAMRRQQCVLSVLLSYKSGQQYKNIQCCTKTALCRIYVADNNKTYFGLYVKRPIFLPHYKQIWSFYTDFHNIFS